MDRGLMARRVGVRFGRWIDAHALHKFFESSLFAVCAAAFGGFDGIEELAAFAAAVFDKRSSQGSPRSLSSRNRIGVLARGRR
jgi:hypothetical protein